MLAAQADAETLVSRRLPGSIAQQRSRARAQDAQRVESDASLVDGAEKPEPDDTGNDDDGTENDADAPPPPPQPRRVHEPSFAWSPSPSPLPVTGEGVMAVVFAGVLLSAAYFGL
ncbi:hypothetical protein Q8F55_008401 [Vanrija albida]|uniref:Uncharacterized protein n=1 Tax=Vanrija albida TaxID=181172 RepID=A0ABR3PW40_9TREE